MKQEAIAFLSWLSKRLKTIHKYSAEDNIILSLENIIKDMSKTKEYDLTLTDSEFDLILSKYYSDFLLDSCDHLNIGYTNDQRNEIRITFKKIVRDVVNRNIPSNPKIKG